MQVHEDVFEGTFQKKVQMLDLILAYTKCLPVCV